MKHGITMFIQYSGDFALGGLSRRLQAYSISMVSIFGTVGGHGFRTLTEEGRSLLEWKASSLTVRRKVKHVMESGGREGKGRERRKGTDKSNITTRWKTCIICLHIWDNKKL